MRVGIGHDTHRLAAPGPLLIGGVVVPSDHGSVGHSDADVLLHAVTDALLGAGGLGDIGRWFPDSDPRWEGADSGQFVTTVCGELAARGWRVINLDCTVFLQFPRIAPHAAEIRQRLATLLRIDNDSINVKAKTGEGLGPIGRGEAISAAAAVLLDRTDKAGRS